MPSDKTTIGLTDNNRAISEFITTERDWFKNQLDAAKFAMSLAIACDIDPGETEGTGTVWNVGSFDPDGELRELIQILFPGTDMPYRLVEHFVNRGLGLISEELEDNPHLELTNLMALAK